MIREKLPIHKQFLVISAPTSFRLVANNGTDFVERPAGVWQLDCYKLLPEKFMKNYPVFNLELEYDDTKIPDGFLFEYYFTNINLGDSLKGVSGDLVELSNIQFDTLMNILNTSEDYPYYKVLSKMKIFDVPFVSNEDSFYFDIPYNSSKNLFLACTLVKKDKKRLTSKIVLVNSQSENRAYYGDFEFYFWYSEKYASIEMRGVGLDVYKAVDGFMEPEEEERYRESRVSGFTFSESVSNDDILYLEFHLLTE